MGNLTRETRGSRRFVHFLVAADLKDARRRGASSRTRAARFSKPSVVRRETRYARRGRPAVRPSVRRFMRDTARPPRNNVPSFVLFSSLVSHFPSADPCTVHESCDQERG